MTSTNDFTSRRIRERDSAPQRGKKSRSRLKEGKFTERTVAGEQERERERDEEKRDVKSGE